MTSLDYQAEQEATDRDRLFDCDECMQTSIDPDDEGGPHQLNGKTLCGSCVITCEDACGDYIEDSSIAKYGPMVRYRRWEMDGKLSDGSHAECAADALLGQWQDRSERDDVFFYSCEHTREEIAEIVAKAFIEEPSCVEQYWNSVLQGGPR